MAYITSFEEFGIAQGRRQEIERSIFRTLRAPLWDRRSGDRRPATIQTIAQSTGGIG